MIIFKNKFQTNNDVYNITSVDKRNLILKIDKLILDKISKNYKIISMLLKKDNDDFYIRDILETNGCFLTPFSHNIVRSSFIDRYNTELITDNSYKIINSFFKDYEITDINYRQLKNNSLINPNNTITKNLFLTDNNLLLDHLDLLNDSFDTNWENINDATLIKTILILSLIPLLHHPMYLNMFIDTKSNTVSIRDSKFLLKDTEYKDHYTYIIKNIILAIRYLCESNIFKHDFIFMININYTEINVHFYDKNDLSKMTFLFNFNTTDFFRLLRTFVGNDEEIFLYNLGKQFNLQDLINNIFIEDKISYLLEYTNFNQKERREDLIF